MMLFGRYAKNGHIFIYTLRAFVFLLSVAVGVAAESTKSPSNKINSATAPSSSLKPKSSAKSPSAGLKSTVWIWDKPYNPSKEVAEISRLADEGNLRAQAEMSLRHRLGDGVPLDTTKALRFCEANTHPIAQYSLSRMLSSGHGVKKDQQRADKILREVFGALRLLSDQRDGLATAILGVYWGFLMFRWI
jgi:hypothetical protein